MALKSTLDFFLEEVFRLPIRKALNPNDPNDFAKIANALAKATAGLAQAEEAKALKAALAALDVDWKKMDGATKLKVVNAAKAAVNPVKSVLPKLEEHFEANAIKIGMATKGATKKTFGFSIAPDLNAVQFKTLQHVALSQGNYVRDEYGKRSDVFGLKAKQIVAEELEKGTSQKEISARLRADLSAQQFNRSTAYWNVVANAFANRARTYTNLSSYEEAGITHFEFESVLDQRTSHVCRLMHGRKFPVAQALAAHAASEKPGGDVKTSMPWVSEGAKDADGNPTLRANGVLVATVTNSAMGQVDEKGTFSGATSSSLASLGIMVPPLHGNCFPAETLVSGRFEGGLRAPYVGKLVEVKTASGRRLSGTPKHPVLTAHGFVALDRLRVGDQLIRHVGGAEVDPRTGALTALDDEHDAPSRIEEVLRALDEVGTTRRVDRRALDLDGDETRFNGDVDVVAIDGALLRDAHAAESERASKRILELTTFVEPLLGRLRASDPRLKRVMASAARALRSLGLLSHEGGVQPHAVPLDELRVGSAAHVNASRYQMAAQGGVADTTFVRDLRERFPRAVAHDEIVEIREYDFAGHVFDLRSPLGWFVASDFYVSNCRSSIIPIMGSHTVLTPSGPMPAELIPPPEPPPFALTSPTAAPAPVPDEPPKPPPPVPEQEGLYLPSLGGISNKPIALPALDPALPPVPAIIPQKDKAAAALAQLDVLKANSADYLDIGAVPNPVTVKKSPFLGVDALGLPKDKTAKGVIDGCLDAWGAGYPGDEYGMKHMPKKLESLKSTSDQVDANKVELYLKNPKLINKAMNDGEIVAVKIGKDIFIIQGHDYVAAAKLMGRAELKVLEINLKSATAKATDKAHELSEKVAAAKAKADAADALAAKWQAEQAAKDAKFFAEQAAKKAEAAAQAAAANATAAKLAAEQAAKDALAAATKLAAEQAAAAKKLVPPPRPGAPVDSAFIMHEQTNRPGGGSNGGAFYKDASGVERFVKLYKDPGQAHGEVLSNEIYRALGQGGPEAVTFEHTMPNGEKRQAYAAKLIDGAQLGTSPGKEKARKFFDGFAADVLLGNWDAAGQSGDNAFATKAGQIIRLDNGGALLMRAQGGRKLASQLGGITELDTYFPDNALHIRNPGYHALAREAGYSSVDDFKDSFRKQVADLTALRTKHGSWDGFVSTYAPTMPDGPDRRAIVKMLEEKHALLEKKSEEMGRPPPPPGARPSDGYRAPSLQNGTKPRAGLKLADLKETPMPADAPYGKTPWGEDAYKHKERVAKELAVISSAQKNAIGNFTNGDYNACRRSEAKGPDGPLNEDARHIKGAFEKMRAEPGSSWRGATVPEKVVQDMLENTGIHRLGHGNTPATTSTTWRFDVAREWSGGTSEPPSGNVRIKYLIHHRSGVLISPISRIQGEDEVLIPAAAQFRVVNFARLKGHDRVLFIELEEIGPDDPETTAPPAKKPRKPRKPKTTA